MFHVREKICSVEIFSKNSLRKNELDYCAQQKHRNSIDIKSLASNKHFSITTCDWNRLQRAYSFIHWLIKLIGIQRLVQKQKIWLRNSWLPMTFIVV